MMNFNIGKLHFKSCLIQGPLAGYTCAPFRHLVWRYSTPAYCVSEMISARSLVGAPEKISRRYLAKTAAEKILCVQLSANDPELLKQACQLAASHGADLLDLNCGCPVKKIRSKQAGSKHLSMPSRLEKMVKTMKSSTDLPVTIKIRVDGDSGDNFNRDVAQAIEAGGADALIVHGRHWTERYDVNVRIDEIASFVEQVTIPVIGNGDADSVETCQRLLKVGCAAVMIARASVGQPWLFAKIEAALAGKTYTSPTIDHIAALFLEHIHGLAEIMQSEYHAVLHARKLAKYYTRDFPGRDAFCAAVQETDNLAQLKQVVANKLT